VVECAGHKRPYRSSEADALALTGFTFGLDIVLFVRLCCKNARGER